jgi:cell cycle arrest protein BUB3
MWDWVGKKRLAQFTSYPAPITALAFNKDGTALAVGSSYDYAAGEPGAAPPPAPAVFVRTVADGDVRPKAAAAKA